MLRRLLVPLALVAVALAAAAGGGARTNVTHKLIGEVGPGFTIEVTTPADKDVKTTKAGTYTIVVHDDSAGVDHFEAPAVVFGSPMYTVARNPGFVPDNGAPLSCDAIEKGGLSYVGPADNDHCGSGLRHALL